MNATPWTLHALACHPQSQPIAVRSVSAAARRTPAGALALRYALAGDLAAVALPEAGAPQRADGLWRQTCFECFLRTGARPYLEFNFSPSRAWAAYAFVDYRVPGPLPQGPEPRVALARTPGTLTLEAMVPAAWLPPASQAWRIALTAVVEEHAGLLSYWSLRHAPGQPDFHDPRAGALTL